VWTSPLTTCRTDYETSIRLLLVLWREKHPNGHEQTMLDLHVQRRPAAATIRMFKATGKGMNSGETAFSVG
jgi:hypothetical protein